jgi:hypothetical protein
MNIKSAVYGVLDTVVEIMDIDLTDGDRSMNEVSLPAGAPSRSSA